MKPIEMRSIPRGEEIRPSKRKQQIDRFSFDSPSIHRFDLNRWAPGQPNRRRLARLAIGVAPHFPLRDPHQRPTSESNDSASIQSIRFKSLDPGLHPEYTLE